MQDDKKMSRKQFLALAGSAVGALVAGRVAGMVGSVSTASNVSLLKNTDANAYGNFPYGGIKA